jgi:hypothetical protein
MSPQEWEEAEQRCTLFSSAKLLCDGYVINLKEERLGYRVVVAIYVNGEIRGEWLCDSVDSVEKKFYPRKKKYIHSEAIRGDHKKLSKKGKRDDFLRLE